jgi:glycosyltransferase involved in cell wall biosynthesis
MTYLVLNYEYPPLGGGAASATQNLAQALQKRGNKVVVLTSAFRDLTGEQVEQGITVVRVPALRRQVHGSGMLAMTAYILAGSHKIGKIAQKYSVDRMLAFFSIPSGVVSWWFSRNKNLSYAVSVRGGDVPGTEKGLWLFYAITAPLRRRVLRQARFITAPSQALADLAEKADPVRIETVPNGVDTELFRPDRTSRPDTLTLLFVGRLHPQKDVHRLIEVVQSIRDSGEQNVRARIIGDGPQRRQLETFAARQSLEKHVIFEGWVVRSKLAQAYREATFLAQFSSYEGLSNVMLEALASGLPVVASNLKANTEIVESSKNGLLVPAEVGPAELGATLVGWHQDRSLWQRLSENARQSVLERFDWSRVAARYEELFERSATRPSS